MIITSVICCLNEFNKGIQFRLSEKVVGNHSRTFSLYHSLNKVPRNISIRLTIYSMITGRCTLNQITPFQSPAVHFFIVSYFIQLFTAMVFCANYLMRIINTALRSKNPYFQISRSEVPTSCSIRNWNYATKLIFKKIIK